MKLVIAEKPSVAMALAKVVGARERKGRICGGKGVSDIVVRWASRSIL